MKRNEELEIQIITQQKENEAKEAQLSSQLAESQNTISELKCGWLCGVTCSEKSKALGDSISRMTVELAKKEEASQSSVSELEALKGELEEAFPGYEIYMAPLSLSVACHIGPGARAVTVTKLLHIRDRR